MTRAQTQRREERRPAPATTLETLAARVDGLHLSWTDPERAYVEKHTIASELRHLARELRRVGA